MLSKNEKRTIEHLWQKGRSYQEIAQELIAWRNALAFGALCVDVEAYIKEKEQ